MGQGRTRAGLPPRSAHYVRGDGSVAWGPAVFSDDVARDVRDRYREHLEDQMADDEAEATILREFAGHLGDVDDGPVVWLALAATESKLGRISAVVQSKALDIIDRGPDSSVSVPNTRTVL